MFDVSSECPWLKWYPTGYKTNEQVLAMSMTSGIDFCKCFANSFVAEAYKRKAGLGTLLTWVWQ